MTGMIRYNSESDDSWPSSAESSSSSSDGDSSTTISNLRDYDDKPDWMKKFEVAKSVKSISDTATLVSETKSKSQHSKPEVWMKKFERARDERSLTNPSLPTKENGKKETEWLKNIEKHKAEPTSTFIPLPTKEKGQDNGWLIKFEGDKDGVSLPTKAKDKKESDGLKKIENAKDEPSSTSTSLSTIEKDKKESDWLKKFEKAKDERSSATTSLPTKEQSDGRDGTNLNAGETRAERRERIRRNLEKLRRRERIRRNLSTLQAQRNKEQPEKQEQRDNKELRENVIDTPTMSSRMRKYERAIFKGMDKAVSPLVKDKRKVSMTSKTTNQTAAKKYVGPQTKSQNMWSITTKPNKQTSKKDQWFKPVNNAYAGGNGEATPRQKVSDTKTQAKHVSSKQNVANVVTSAPSPSQKEMIQVPSLESKMNALRQAMSPKPNVPEPKKLQNHKFTKRKIENVAKSVPSPSQKELIRVPSIESKVNALQQKVNKNSKKKSCSKSDKKAGVTKPPIPTTGKQNANWAPPRTKTPAPRATHPNADFGSTNAIPEEKIVEPKPRIARAEIENTVPENLFRMWGDTVKVKTPIPDSPMLNDRVVKKQANKIKERIEKAKKEAMDASDGQNREGANNSKMPSSHIQVEVDSETKDGLDHHSSMHEDAAALFYAAGSKTSDYFDYDIEEVEYYTESDEEVLVDDEAAAPFHATGGASKETGGNTTTEIDYDTDEIEIVDESETDEAMDDYADAAAFVGSSSPKDTEMNGIHRPGSKADELDDETSVDYDESEMDETMDDYADAALGSSSNRRVESQRDEYDEETSVDYDKSEMADTMDEFPSPAKNYKKNRLDEFEAAKDELDEEASVDLDESEMADTMDEYPSPTKDFKKNRLDKFEAAKDDSDRDLDATMNSGILSPAKAERKSDTKNKLNNQGNIPFYGSAYGNYRNAPEYSSSNSSGIYDDIPPVDPKNPAKSLLEFSATSSSEHSLSEKEENPEMVSQREVRQWAMEKISNHSKKDYTMSKYNIPDSKTARSFEDDGSFFASDFSDASFEIAKPRVLEKKAKRSSEAEKKAKKSKKPKPKKTKSKKSLKSKKKDKKK